ncbi:MAG: cytochrome c biogenesis protein CcsA [Spirochaetales bacterium]|nr:cytochrome c biogenesis protein CcsA [Leptospiraceae bacterium]MCP5483653.1 cytochrome c biogenesis protein CcsA [Spirochaetales bacterium]MCP5484482.1 cytochrome c biogenesis protein CcsA [Spirochaetales bacterium]
MSDFKKQNWSFLLDIALVGGAFGVVPIVLVALTYPAPLLEQGQAHRIFYLHVPVAWVALYAPLLAAVCGLLYLFLRTEAFDVWCHANVRLALLFSIGVIISGMLWASTEWARGVYWNWADQRLTSFFVLFLILCGYFLVRYLTDDPSRRATYGAFMAILAAAASVLSWFVIRISEPVAHPTPVIGDMSPRIGQTFWLGVLAFHLLFLAMLRLAVRQEWLRRAREALSGSKI